jgi:hypothetical protein
LLEPPERPVLGDPHRTLALAENLRDLLDVEVTERAQQHDLGLIGRQAAHEHLERTLRRQLLDCQSFRVAAVRQIARILE